MRAASGKLRPPRLRPGDRVGVVAPASPHYQRTALERGIRTLEEWGFEVVRGKHLERRHGYLAGTDAERAEDLVRMFADPSVRAVLCTQGGYGSGRLVRHLDFGVIAANPKVFVGFSDITALHLAIGRLANLVTFHGPGVMRYNPEELGAYRQEYLFRALMGEQPLGEVRPSPRGPYVYTLVDGQARGELVGGCLSLLTSSLGTPWEIETRGRILFFEEVHAEPYLVDWHLTCLLNAGKLQEAAAIVVGECVDCEYQELRPAFPEGTLSLEDVLHELIVPLGIPSFYGLPLGHGKDMATLPLGVTAFVDAGQCRLVVEERGTVD